MGLTQIKNIFNDLHKLLDLAEFTISNCVVQTHVLKHRILQPSAIQ